MQRKIVGDLKLAGRVGPPLRSGKDQSRQGSYGVRLTEGSPCMSGWCAQQKSYVVLTRLCHQDAVSTTRNVVMHQVPGGIRRHKSNGGGSTREESGLDAWHARILSVIEDKDARGRNGRTKVYFFCCIIL